ncbi:MAG: 3-dehydroquinate synthase [Chlamydiales bacterium]
MTSEVWIGKGILKEKSFREKLLKLSSRFALIMDEGVAKLFKEKLFAHGLDLELFTFPPGEKHKTRETKQALEDQMLSRRFGRTSALIAMGGGVVTDLGGFVAATFCRGVPLILIPTTLMGMVDACIGGKTGVNTPHGKNLIGAFYSAQLVVSDLDCLTSLPAHEVRSGMAEVIKYALTLDPSLLDVKDQETLVRRSCALKEEVVGSDFGEDGRRRLINFGHTVGHALERIEEWRMPHGDAVAIGMLIECLISVELGYLKKEDFFTALKWVCAYDFPLALSSRVTLESLLSAMAYDKKSSGPLPSFVLLKKIGEVVPFGGRYCIEVDPKILEKALQKYAEIIDQTKPA